MTKKKKIILSILLAIVLTITGVELYNNHWDRKYGSFDLDKYSYHYEKPYDSYVYLGEIKTSAEARRKAEKLWKAVYGDWVVFKKPYHVFFDEENRVWFVTGDWYGETDCPYLLIQEEDGKVLALWSNHLF